ncbi:MAG: DUF6056 family protein [Anaerostipes hadrus]|nr:DUF6056 family protein [Anaerostipes hadrus]
MEKQKYLKAEIAVFFLMILIEAICAYYYPLTGDDRYFQSLNVLSVGKMIQYLKAFGNGRYLGNLAVVLLVNNKMLRVMVKTICIVGIWVNLVYLCELEEGWKKGILAILVIFPTNLLSAQVYVWTAGFCNYVLCVFLELTALSCLKKYNKCKSAGIRIVLLIVLFMFALLAQLCSENSTVINIAILMILIIDLIKHKKDKIAILIFSIATFIGTGLMFFGPKYFRVAYKMDTYRKIPNTLGTIISTAMYNVLTINRCMMGNFFLFLLLAIVIYYLYNKNIKYYLLIGLGVYSFLYFLMDNDREWVYPNFILRNIISMFMLVICLIVVFIILKKNRKSIENKILINYGLIVFSIMPLLIVTPIGARTLFYTYILFVGFVIQLMNKISLKEEHLIYKTVNIIMITLLISSIIMWSNIHYADTVRNNYIKEKMNKKENQINIPALPKQDYLWNDTMIKESFDCLYKYKKQGDIKFNVQTWDIWYEENFLN